jgi:hypothetical protein
MKVLQFVYGLILNVFGFILDRLRCVVLDTGKVFFPKKQMTIKGNAITYREASTAFLGDEGVVVFNRFTRKITIYIAKNQRFPRCAVYHEFCEGMAMKQKRSAEEIYSFLASRINLLLEVYEVEPPSSTDKITLDGEMFLKKWIKTQRFHVEAIIKEIELAKEELGEDDLQAFYKELRDNFRVGYVPLP